MKKLLLSLVILSLFGNLSADIIPISFKSINYCTYLLNTDSFPSVSFIFVNRFPSTKKFEIKSNDCFEINNYYHDGILYAINKTYLNNKGVDNIDFTSDKNCAVSNLLIFQRNSIYVPDTSTIAGITVYFKILGFTDTSTIIFCTKKIIQFDHGLADSVYNYEIPVYNNLKNELAVYSGVKKLTNPSNLLLYPSPSQQILNLYSRDALNGKVEVEIYNMSGHLMITTSYIKSQKELKKTLDISSLKPGIYNLKYTIGNYSESRLILKQ
jgi:hypothetical protein